MSIFNEEFSMDQAVLDYQLKEVTNPSDVNPHGANNAGPLRQKVLTSYESKMRSIAARCEEGR
jgi:hypothetical protein